MNGFLLFIQYSETIQNSHPFHLELVDTFWSVHTHLKMSDVKDLYRNWTYVVIVDKWLDQRFAEFAVEINESVDHMTNRFLKWSTPVI